MEVFGRRKSTPPKRNLIFFKVGIRYSDQCMNHHYRDPIQQQQKYNLNENNIQIIGPGPDSSPLRIVCRTVKSHIFTSGFDLRLYSFTYLFILFHMSVYHFFQVNHLLKPVFLNKGFKVFPYFLKQNAFKFPRMIEFFTLGDLQSFVPTKNSGFPILSTISYLAPKILLFLYIL